MFTVAMKTISLWLSVLLGTGAMVGCSKQTGGGSSSELELQAARQSVKQLQDQLSQVSAEMSERIRKEGERVKAEMKPQVDRASADLAKARRQVAELEARAKELEALAQEAASRPEEPATVDPLAIPSDLFLNDAGLRAPGIAVRLADGQLVVRTESGTLVTNSVATIREIDFRSGPVLAGVAATNSVATTKARKPAMKPYRPPGSGVKLSPYWRAPVPGGELMIKDLRNLLAERAQPKAELGVVESREIIKGVYYLMPAQEVFKVLGKRPAAARKAIEAPGFPKQSFYYYELAGDFNDFPNLLLITDSTDQTLAVQLSNDAMNERPHLDVRDEGYMIHNLVKGRKKPNINCFINYRGSVTNDTVVLDSRLYDPLAALPRNAQSWERNQPEHMRMKERHILYLPQPVANLVSLCLGFY